MCFKFTSFLQVKEMSGCGKSYIYEKKLDVWSNFRKYSVLRTFHHSFKKLENVCFTIFVVN